MTKENDAMADNNSPLDVEQTSKTQPAPTTTATPTTSTPTTPTPTTPATPATSKKPSAGDKQKCAAQPEPPTVKDPPKRPKCETKCACPTPPGGKPNDCLAESIRTQAELVTKAERAKALVEELTAFQGKLASAQADYTQARYTQLNKLWWEQDKLIAALTKKLECSVPCWECLLECRLCTLIEEIRALEDLLNGTEAPPNILNGTEAPPNSNYPVYSLIDKQFWLQRNVTQLKARVDRINVVLGSWEKPSENLGDVLDKNGKLAADLPAVLAADPAKAIYDIFMTLVPRHWGIRPRDATSAIEQQFIKVCVCDKGAEDVCCGPDVGLRSLRDRLVGTLPYIVDPANLTEILCCLITERLVPASAQLADAEAKLAATTLEIEQAPGVIETKTAAIEAAFKAELGNPIDCGRYPKKPSPPPTKTPTTEDGGATTSTPRRPDKPQSDLASGE
ncbi:MAG: hypothetical protein ABI580_01920 [Burkholderiaceae bacterium]